MWHVDRMDSRANSLLEWVAKLPMFVGQEKPKLNDFTDGVVLGKILRDTIDPNFFRELDNTPLVKVVDKMKQYLATQVGHQMPHQLLPNCGKIVSGGDTREIGRVLQLLVGCAVQCPRKENYVKMIMESETKVQVILMEAIEEIIKEEKVSLPYLREDINQITILQERIEELSQENHDLKGQLSHIEEERLTLTSENQRLNSQLTSHMADPESIQMTMKVHDETKKEVESLRDQNYKLEASVDDYRLKTEVLQKQLKEAHSKMASTAGSEEDIVRLKDEIDILREAAAKATQYESSIRSLKKKLEDMTVLKGNLKVLEEKNEELHKANIHFEDEMRKVGALKSQIDVVKKELAETQQRLSIETQRAVKAEFDFKLLREKHDSVQLTASRFQEDKIRLTEQLDEVRLNTDMRGDAMNIPSGNGDFSMDMLNPNVRQRILRLELENKKLNEKLTASIESGSADEGSKVLVEQLRKHEEELDEQLLLKSQELIDSQTVSAQKIQRLEAQLLEKEEELAKKKLQYEKCIEKAKSVVNTLEPTASAGLNLGKVDPEKEKAQAIREREEKLMASVFYNLSLQLHRGGVETRNTTFLQRHRHPNAPRRKSEM